MKLFLIILSFLGFYGCASSSRVDVLADQIKAQGIKIQTLEQTQVKDENHMIDMHNRFASNESKTSELSIKVNDLDHKVNNLTSKFDSKFRNNIMK